MQGGMSRSGAATEGAPRPGQPQDGAGNRNNSAAQAQQQQASDQAGQNAALLPPQLQGIMPSFVSTTKHSFKYSSSSTITTT